MGLNSLIPNQLDKNANYQGPGQYLHYKGSEYHVHGIALQEDTVPKTGQPTWSAGESGDHMLINQPVFFVIYQPLTEGSMLEQMPHVRFWARKLSDFNMKVECTTFHDDEGNEYEEEGGYLVRRFVKIPDIDEADLVWAIQEEAVRGLVKASVGHKPSGLTGLGEGESRLQAFNHALLELRRNLARKNASV